MRSGHWYVNWIADIAMGANRIAVYKLAAYLPPSFVRFIENKVLWLRGFLEDNDILPKTDRSPDSESKVVTEARDAVKAEEKRLGELKTQLKDHQSDLETDYGPGSILRPLKGVCTTRDSGEYTYEHCFLDQTKQNSKKGGSSVRMGKFVSIGSVTKDELNNAGEIVPVEKMTLEYANGQACWQGPSRSTTVVLECGEENEILKINEDEKCVYSMKVTTPAVCVDGQEGKAPPRNKDEL